MPPKPSPFPWTGRLFISFPRNISLTIRTASKSPWVCAGCVWKPRSISSPARWQAPRTSSSAATARGVDVADIVLEQLASSESVLTPEEQELGVAILDIGGGTTDIAIFVDGSIRHSAVLSLGGNHLTNDIAVGLRTPMAEAEKIKREYGCALGSMVGKNETIEVPSVGGREPRTLSRHLLTEILEPRVEEIFSLADQEIRHSGYGDLIASGVVLTGGTSILPGMPEMAEQIFNLPVRRGNPRGFGGLTDVVNSPIFATGVGLVKYGSRNMEARNFTIGQDNIFSKVIRRMKEWFGDFF